jgi:hypothetical protein
MSNKEAYLYIFKILKNYWGKTHIDERGSLLGELNPFLFMDGNPADPAAWHDWMKAIRKVASSELLTEEQARKAMILLLQFYNDHEGFDLVDVIEDLRKFYKIEV